MRESPRERCWLSSRSLTGTMESRSLLRLFAFSRRNAPREKRTKRCALRRKRRAASRAMANRRVVRSEEAIAATEAVNATSGVRERDVAGTQVRRGEAARLVVVPPLAAVRHAAVLRVVKDVRRGAIRDESVVSPDRRVDRSDCRGDVQREERGAHSPLAARYHR